MSATKQRIDFIDLAKGVCIIWVVLGHIGVPAYLPGMGSTRMPLYFVLSGLFFKDYGGGNTFIIKKINKILVPFLFFYLTAYLFFYIGEWLASGVIKTDANGILDVFTQRQWFNGPIWFLLALFWSNMMMYGIHLMFKTEYQRAAAVMILGVTGLLLGQQKVFLSCNIDSAFSAMPFFYFGYILRKTPFLYPNRYDKFNLLWIALLYGVACFIELRFDHPRIGFHDNNITGNYALIVLVSLSSVLAVLLLCKMIRHIPVVSYFGRYSIITLCVHHMVYRPLKLVLVHFDIMNNWTMTVFTLSICLLLIPVCIRCIPWFTAQKDLFHVKGE